jgi:exodeoxyribonuclease VII small subunit
MTKSVKNESATYKTMLAEVEGIVRDVGAPDLDLDEMVQKVETGYGLIKTMRARLDQTKKKIEELRLEFDGPA